MTVPNPYRCGTCNFYFRNFCDSEGEIWNKCNIGSCQIDLNRGILIDRVGCTSHSGFQAEQDNKVLDICINCMRRNCPFRGNIKLELVSGCPDKVPYSVEQYNLNMVGVVTEVLDKLEQWHYDEINRFKLRPPSIISYPPSISAHKHSIKRIKELRQNVGGKYV